MSDATADDPVNPGSSDPLETAEAQEAPAVAAAAAAAAEPTGTDAAATDTAETEVQDAPEPAAAPTPLDAASAPGESAETELAAVAPTDAVSSEDDEAVAEAVSATPVLSELPPPAVEAAAPALEAPPAPAPSIAATLEAPPLAGGSPGTAGAEGGEFDLLVSKLTAFLQGDSLRNWWERLGGPLRGVGLLIGLVLVLRLYDALLDTLGDLPLVPRLLQLAGLITVLRFALTRLVRTEERQAVLNDWKTRWQRFRGTP